MKSTRVLHYTTLCYREFRWVVYTYTELSSSAYDGPSLEWVILGSRWEYTTSTRTLRTAEWMIDAQNFWAWRARIDDDHFDSWTCQAGMDGNRHQPQSHSNTVSGTSAWEPSLTLPVGDHSASKTKATQRHLTFHANKKLCLCLFTPMLNQLLQLMSPPLTSWCLLQASYELDEILNSRHEKIVT